MKKTVYALATHYGDYALDYERFFYENRKLLAENGTAYPWLSTRRNDFPWQVQIGAKAKALLEGDRNVCQDLANELQGQESILLVAPVGLLSGAAPKLLEFFRSSPDFAEWANPDVHIAWLARERSSEIEGAALYNLPRDATQDLFRNSIKNVQTFLENLKHLLNFGSSVTILPDFSDQHLPVNAILDALGIEIPKARRIPLRQTPVASRETLYALSRLRQSFPGIDPIPLGYKPSMPDASPFTMMPPEHLEQIYEATAGEMEKIAKAHGTDLEFPWPVAQPGWQPCKHPGQDFYQRVYEEALENRTPETQDLELRILQNVWNEDWLAKTPVVLAQSLRKKFNLPAQPEPLLSVLTLTKNQEKYIGECIESVLAQKTDFPVRHIILDDCSQDDTPKIIRKYAEKYSSIFPIFLKSHKAYGDNVRALFSACHSKYAALCDGDDFFIDARKMQKQVDFLEAHPDCAICFHPVQKRYEDGSPTEIYPPKSILPGDGKRHIFTLRDLLKGNIIQTNSVVYRWRFRRELPEWFDATLTPADWYWHLLHAETGMIGYLPEEMAVYRRHATSLFAVSETNHIEHRKQFGHAELKLYGTLDKHFKGKYRNDFLRLANGVFADYVKVYMETGDDELLNSGMTEYPAFAKYFLSELKLD